jgi:hypothetical protein
MVTILSNGKNFAECVKQVGQTFVFESTSEKITIKAYYKSQPKTQAEKDARPLGGNKTQVTVVWENGTETSHNTDELRAKKCPDYATSPKVSSEVTRDNLKERIEVIGENIKLLQTQLKNLKQLEVKVIEVEKVLGFRVEGETFKNLLREFQK